MTGICAVVPVKPLPEAKGRLRGTLSAAARRRLVLTMLADVLQALREVPEISRVIVVTPDADVAALAQKQGAAILTEPCASGLNEGVGKGLAAAEAAGFAAALVLPADLPFATAEEIRRLVERPAARQLSMVPATDGDGTNALLIAPPLALAPAFGPGSFLAHLARALTHKVDVRVLHLSGLAHDIDRPEDLGRLYGLDRYAFLGNPAPPNGTEISSQ
ncbi:MAG: 2-phospho-L-lactate guanylyltransferase [Hyphomicrobiales bacterium]|nr:MAG: 2-phospho-L-lactate guanylyltransferase [Hyphomicrobiales bacterium]